MDKKKILVIIPFVPYPLNTGGNQGSFHMLNYIKDFFDVHVWFHINNPQKEKKLLDEFSSALNNEVTIHFSSNKVGRNYITARALKRKFDAIFLKHDLQYLHNQRLWGEGVSGYADLQALEDINKIISAYKIDIVQIEYSMVLDMIYAIPKKVKKVFVHHELGFARQSTLMDQLEHKYAYDEYWFRKNMDYEISALNRYDVIITMSDIDKGKLLENGVKTQVVTSPSFIPQPDFPEFKIAKHRLTYVASGGHFPNIEGLEWFIKNVHPLLIEKDNDYLLEVCGPKWDVAKLSVEIPENIHFLGFVEDLRNIVPGSVMIVPILSGSGMRMKILESVNNSVPFVSTTVGAEGLLFENCKDCYITDDSRGFANCIFKLLQDANLQKEFVDNAKKLYEENYSPEIQAKKRLSILQNV